MDLFIKIVLALLLLCAVCGFVVWCILKHEVRIFYS